MATSPLIPCSGLQTDRSLIEAPLGATRRADNVVIDAPGVASARPNFALSTAKETKTVETEVALIANVGPGDLEIRPISLAAFPLVGPYEVRLDDGAGNTELVTASGTDTVPYNRIVLIDAVVGGYNAGPGTVTMIDDTVDNDFRIRTIQFFQENPLHIATNGGDWQMETATAVKTGDATPPDYDRAATQFAEARGNLYFTTLEGVKKLCAWDDAALAVAGMHEAPQGRLALSTDASWLPDTNAVAYRFLFRKTDANGVVTRSAPSAWTYILNNAGAPRSVSLTIPLASYAAVGDVIEVYRSRVVSSGTPSDTLYLTMSHTLTSGDLAGAVPGISMGSVTISDILTEDRMGELLYTSSTREGIENANYPPPQCLALETWRDSLWFGATKTAHVLVVDLLRVVGTWYGTGITGDTTSGSPDILNVSSTANLRVGQLLSSTTVFAAGTKITDIVGTTVTVSSNAASTNVGATLSFRDVITINGHDYAAGASTAIGPPDTFAVSAAVLPGPLAYETARAIAYLVSSVDDGIVAQAVEDTSTSAYTRTGRLVFRLEDVSDESPFTFASTMPDGSFEAVLDSLTSERENKPNRIYYSKPQEPEHVPSLNWLSVGGEGAYVQRMVGLPAAMLVFTSDGVYRVTGSYPSFSVDTIVPGLRLARPECVSVMEDVVYAWTDRGVLEMTENGVAANLTEGLIRDDLIPFALQYTSDDDHDAFLVAWRDQGLVLLGVGDGEQRSLHVYAWSTLTRSWSRWPFAETRGWSCAAYDQSSLALHHALAHRWETRAHVQGEPRGYDRSHEIGTWTYDPGSTVVEVLTSDIGSWVPAVGDWLSYGDEWRRVLAVESNAGPGWTLTIDESFSVDQGAYAAYEGAPALIEWLAQTAGGPSMGGLVRELHLHLDVSRWTDALDEHARISAGAASSLAAAATLTATPTLAAVLSRPVRFGMPRAVARSAHLYPRVAINERFRWRALGICLVGEGVSEKVRK